MDGSSRYYLSIGCRKDGTVMEKPCASVLIKYLKKKCRSDAIGGLQSQSWTTTGANQPREGKPFRFDPIGTYRSAQLH